jgi:hypothetical protein
MLQISSNSLFGSGGTQLQMPALRRLTQEDLKFKVSLRMTEITFQKTKN